VWRWALSRLVSVKIKQTSVVLFQTPSVLFTFPQTMICRCFRDRSRHFILAAVFLGDISVALSRGKPHEYVWALAQNTPKLTLRNIHHYYYLWTGPEWDIGWEPVIDKAGTLQGLWTRGNQFLPNFPGGTTQENSFTPLFHTAHFSFWPKRFWPRWVLGGTPGKKFPRDPGNQV